jgi:hypothetical protein
MASVVAGVRNIGRREALVVSRRLPGSKSLPCATRSQWWTSITNRASNQSGFVCL